MTDLRERVPGHSLIEMLLRQWDAGAIHLGDRPDQVVIDDDARGWYAGVLGERRVAQLLAQLGEGWTVLHSVPVGSGSSDIDHIVIGQAGVFTINTKYSPGRRIWAAGHGMRVDNIQQPYVRNAMTEAARATDLLSRASGLVVMVTTLIVFVNPKLVTRKAPAGDGAFDIRVIADDELLAHLRGRPLFSEEQVAQIVNAAVRPETWHSRPVESTMGRHIEREFEALEAAVGPGFVTGPATGTVTRTTTASSPPRYAGSSRRSWPAPRSARGRGRRKPSVVEKLVTSLVVPLAGLIIWLAILNSFTQR